MVSFFLTEIMCSHNESGSNSDALQSTSTYFVDKSLYASPQCRKEEDLLAAAIYRA